MIKLSILFIAMLSLPTFSTEYEAYYINTPESNFPPSKGVLANVSNVQQIELALPKLSHCLPSVQSRLLQHLGKSVQISTNGITCQIKYGEWVAADGQTYTDHRQLVPVPMWTASMIERYYSYEDKGQAPTLETLTNLLYDKNNWKIVPANSFANVSHFFPFSLSSNDVSSCADLKDFTLFGILNELRFPKELTQTITKLEQFPECEKYLSLTVQEAITETSVLIH
ncbi:hypothetical protein [Vibrio alginolyticus]|uniref:hypothetical protein n=1 Tax=Vibrio alginolyticus TaxID=663 RepID=UPI0015F45A2E|nr:hypothetical protein [Vibrio alginolyticus]EJE4208819.1 hypothetical protein [Vibrio parahaemolyticus]